MSTDLHARFAALHDSASPLLLPNAWDAASARLWESLGARAVATSSAALAWACGYADGGKLPRDVLLHATRAIVRVCSVPVTVDVEDGYATDPAAVAALVRDVAAAGAVGINLEDGGGDPAVLAAKIRAIRDALGATPLFVNARTDVYLRGLASGAAAVAMTTERLALYREAGADGGFVPGLVDAGAAAQIARAVPLAINVMALPSLAPVDALARAGVRRISAGPGLFDAAYGAGRDATRAFLAGELPAGGGGKLDYAAMNALFAGLPA